MIINYKLKQFSLLLLFNSSILTLLSFFIHHVEGKKTFTFESCQQDGHDNACEVLTLWGSPKKVLSEVESLCVLFLFYHLSLPVLSMYYHHMDLCDRLYLFFMIASYIWAHFTMSRVYRPADF